MALLKNISATGQIFIGLILGVLTGFFLPQADLIGVLGTAFVEALKAIAPALVFISIISALLNASIHKKGRFRRIIVLYLVSTLTAAFIAVIACFIFPIKIHFLNAVSQTAPAGLKEVFLSVLNKLIDNPVSVLLNANYVGILVWAIVFSVALKNQATDLTKNFIFQFSEALTTVVRWIIAVAPIGIMGVMFTFVSQDGLHSFGDYGKLLILLVCTMLLVGLIVNPLIVFLIIRRNPYPLVFRCLKDSGVTAFFTRSSAANIPINMKLCEDLKLDKEIYSVSIPLGATVNMNGAAITITIMTMATAHTLGVEVTFFSALAMGFLAALAACGTSGVAGGSLLLIPMACSLFGIGNDVAMQVIAVGFAISVVQDSLETVLNSSGDVLFVAASEFSEKIKTGEELPKL